MKQFLTAVAALAVLSILSVGCSRPSDASAEGPMSVIFETDMGNDVDDALALDMLYKYMDEGRINLLSVMINKVEFGAAEYADIARTWYGYPDIPVGIIKEGPDCSSDAVNYAEAVATLKKEDGTPAFPRTVEDCSTLPLAVDLYREILAAQPDESVTIVSTGFSTNLARLLDTPADEVSPLTGKELVAQKVKRLVIMAGVVSNAEAPEYNVAKDVPAIQKVAAEWPTELITSPFEIGVNVCYPGQSIAEDFTWADYYPMVEGYKAYLPMPYDRPTWDLTAVLYAVEGIKGDNDASYFNVVGPGKLEFTDQAFTRFTPDPENDRYYLEADSLQMANILGRFKELLVRKPAVVASQE